MDILLDSMKQVFSMGSDFYTNETQYQSLLFSFNHTQKAPGKMH